MQPRNIPGFAEVVVWPVQPTRPLRIADGDVWRSGGAYVLIAEAAGSEFPFGFDSFLGRLFYGSTDERSADAARVRVGSPLAAEVLPLLHSASFNPEWPWLADYVGRAAHWCGWVSAGDASE